MLILYLLPFCGKGLAKSSEVATLVCHHFGSGAKVCYNERGKPLMIGAPGFLSVSHSKGMGALLLSDREVGVDMERLRPPPSKAAALFEETEPEAFFRRWTRMEAMQKIEELPMREALCRKEDGFLLTTLKRGEFILSIAQKSSPKEEKPKNIQIVDKTVDSVDNFGI